MQDKDNKNISVIQESQQEYNPLKLDYTLEQPEDRVELVRKIVENTPPNKLNNKYLEILADYIIFAMTKKEKKEKNINTDNRMVTINRRETSFQGLVGKFENGEDGVYNMIINDDKNILLTPKYKITQEDVDTMPQLRRLRGQIEKLEKLEKTARGKKKYLLKKQIIQMRQDQYIIKNSYKPVIYSLNLIKSFSTLDLSDKIEIDEDGNIVNHGLISLFNPTHVSILLCNYSKIKQEADGHFTSDIYYLMQDLQNLVDAALKEKYPIYYDILIYKIDGKTNLEIQELLFAKHGVSHSIEYISSLWRKKIPKLIAEYEEKDYLVWYYTNVKKGQWKRCSRCGQIKLVHNKFFSKNKTSKDHFYSICKDCRNAKTREKKGVG